MSRTPQGAPGSIILQMRAGRKVGHVSFNRQTGKYVALFDGRLLGSFDWLEDATYMLEAEVRKYNVSRIGTRPRRDNGVV